MAKRLIDKKRGTVRRNPAVEPDAPAAEIQADAPPAADSAKRESLTLKLTDGGGFDLESMHARTRARFDRAIAAYTPAGAATSGTDAKLVDAERQVRNVLDMIGGGVSLGAMKAGADPALCSQLTITDAEHEMIDAPLARLMLKYFGDASLKWADEVAVVMGLGMIVIARVEVLQTMKQAGKGKTAAAEAAEQS